MRKYLSILCVVLALLFVVSTTCYAKDFNLTIDSEKVTVVLPEIFPNMDKASGRAETCWNADLCAATFCLSDEPVHGHARIFYSGTEVVALGCVNVEGDYRWWLYEKGISTEVGYEELLEALFPK